jgi:hypothetical protein
MRTCRFIDDNGTVCKEQYSESQHKQDGMCLRCAELLWNNFIDRLNRNLKPIPMILGDKDETL